jgi:hypothetical protein
MTEHEPGSPEDPADDLDDLERQLEDVDAAEAPDTAEHVARLLGQTLDDIDGGSGSATS